MTWEIQSLVNLDVGSLICTWRRIDAWNGSQFGLFSLSKANLLICMISFERI